MAQMQYHPHVKFTPYICALTILCLLGCAVLSHFGQLKNINHWNWVDIFGEGGSTLFVGFWIALILKGRPYGRVTNYIFFGLSFIFFHLWMDTLDEFIQLPKSIHWHAWLESIPFPIGIALLSLGFFYWQQEQLAISKQMLKRERIFRDHRLFDALTPLADATYFKTQISQLIHQGNAEQHHVILIDMANFSHINQCYGFEEGSLILQYISQILVLNLREDDLVCRFAGDRFVVLLPNTPAPSAQKIEQQLKHVIHCCRYYPQTSKQHIALSAHSVCTAVTESTTQAVLKQLNMQLHQHKKQHRYRSQATTP